MLDGDASRGSSGVQTLAIKMLPCLIAPGFLFSSDSHDNECIAGVGWWSGSVFGETIFKIQKLLVFFVGFNLYVPVDCDLRRIFFAGGGGQH